MSARILTTHTRSLPRPGDVLQMLFDRDEGQEHDGELLERRLRESVADVVQRQLQAGIDVVSDGEQSRISHATYARERLAGFEGEGPDWDPHDVEEHPDWRQTPRPYGVHVRRPICVGPIRYVGHTELQRDIANVKAAVERCTGGRTEGTFISTVSPGALALFLENEHYPDRESYVGALADALREEYRAIVDAGLQIEFDCTDLAGARHMRFSHLSLDEFRSIAALNVDALNHAIAGLPADRMRLHLAWGTYPGPHHLDVPLRDIIDLVFRANVAGIGMEASNVRHAHEHDVFHDVRLPEGRYVVPGLVDPTVNRIEHPELIAQRLVAYGRKVGMANLMAGTDGGFATWSGGPWVAPSIVWSKFHALCEGARLATDRLRGAAL